MTVANLEALNLLLERSTIERDRLAVDLRRAEEVASRMRRQGEQLAAYRAEYLQRWSSQFGRGGAIEIVQCYQSFMQRLDEAVLQQQRQVDLSERSVDTQREALVQAEMRVASVRKLLDRRRAELQRVQARHDQRTTDEAAQQAGARRARHLLVMQH